MEKVKRDRTFYRARFIPLDELYSKEELQDLIRDFSTGANEKGNLNMVNLIAVLASMNFELSGFFPFFYLKWNFYIEKRNEKIYFIFCIEEEVDSYLRKLNESYNHDEIDLQLFARLVAILLEEINNLQMNKPQNEENNRAENPEGERYQTENYQGEEEQEDYYLHSDGREEADYYEGNYAEEEAEYEKEDDSWKIVILKLKYLARDI